MANTDIFICTDCRRTYLGKPAQCRWCQGAKLERLGPSESPFDPFAYAKDFKEHPERYGSIAKLAKGVEARMKKKRSAGTA